FGCVVSRVTVLLWPLFPAGSPPFVFYSLGCALSWTFATVYVKWAKLTVEPLTNAAWQLLFGLVFITAGSFLFEGHPHLWPMTNETILAVLFVGLFGVGLAHFLWWSIVDRLPAVTASLGSLLVPVIGVTSSVIVLGERLTVPDIVGFAMIFAAAACVLLQPNVRHDEMPERPRPKRRQRPWRGSTCFLPDCLRSPGQSDCPKAFHGYSPHSVAAMGLSLAGTAALGIYLAAGDQSRRDGLSHQRRVLLRRHCARAGRSRTRG